MNDKKIKGRIIGFQRRNIKNEQTGEVSSILRVVCSVDIDPINNYYGRAILETYCSENAFSKLQSSIDKEVTLEIEYKQVFGKSNTFKQVVSKIDGFDVRKFV